VYKQKWQLSLQYELPGGYVVDAAYVGNRGTRIETSRNLAALPNVFLSTQASRDDAWNNYIGANVPNPFYPLLPGTGLAGSNVSRSRLMRPYPHFGQVNTTTNEGYSWYHSAQLNAQKRFSRGYTVLASYTFSKFMAATDFLNAGDAAPTEMISDQDTPHRLTVSAIYELPFGKGRLIGGAVHPVASKIISGWQVQGVYTFQSGIPTGGWGNIIMYGNMTDVRLPSDQQTVERWFNTDAGFEKASGKQLVSNLRTFPSRFGWLRNDNMNNYDLSVLKNTAVAEGRDLQIRGEFLNAFNHPYFDRPNIDVTSANFGRISGTLNYARRIQLSARFVF
jgi:hypothetical protein